MKQWLSLSIFSLLVLQIVCLNSTGCLVKIKSLSSCFFMSINAPQDLAQITFPIYCSPGCNPALIKPFSGSAGLLDLPAPSLFLLLDQRNVNKLPKLIRESSSTAIFKKNLLFQSAWSLILSIFCFPCFFVTFFYCTLL